MKKLLQRTLGAIALLATAMGFATTASAETIDFPGKNKQWDSYTWTKSGDDFTATINDFVFLLAKGSSTTALVAPDDASIRIYANANLTITAPTGYTMTKVEGVTASSNKAVGATVSSGWEVTTKPASGANKSFVFTSENGESSITFDGDSKQFRVKTLTITYSSSVAPTTVAKPSFNPESGAVKAGTEVTISCITEGASIYYTTDNTDPTASSTLYEHPIVVNEDMTIKAIAVKDGYENSGIATGEYTIKIVNPNLDDISTDFFNATEASYNLYQKVSDGTNVTYTAKFYLNNGNMQFNTGSSTSSSYRSGITSTANPDNRVIKNIVVKLGNNNASYIDVNMGNEPGTYEGEIGGSKSSVSILGPSDGVTIEGTVDANDTMVITYTPTANYKYFSITPSDKSVQIASVQVNYVDQTSEKPVLPKPTVKEGVTITETAEGWSVVPTEYPVELTFDVEDGMVVYHMIVPNGSEPAAAPAKEDDGHTVLENNILVLNAPGEVHSVYVSKNGVKSDKKKITAEVPTGIQGIAETTAPVQYFNLQGVRIDKPAKGGIYIKVQGKNTSKIVF